MAKNKLSSILNEISEFIKSLDIVEGISRETEYDLFFSQADEGTLLLSGKEATQYRQCLKILIDTLGNESISPKAIETLYQKTILTALDIAETYLFADPVYQGLLALHQNSQTPVKKSKLHPLTQEQKASNRVLLQKRILIVDTIRRLNIFRVLSERYLNHGKRFDLRFYLIAAICNLKIKFAH
jgi:hypothetical protein